MSHYGYLPRMVQGWNRGYKRLQIHFWIFFPSEDLSDCQSMNMVQAINTEIEH